MHFLMYAIVLAMGIVILFSGLHLFTFEAKGSFQYEFLREVDFNSQLDTIKKQQEIKEFINTQFTTLISNAGFVVSSVNENLNGVPYWHKNGILQPNIRDQLLDQLKEKFPKYQIQEKKTKFIFKLDRDKIEEVNQRGYYYSYEHSPQFKVNIQHLLLEFYDIYGVSKQMLDNCKNNQTLNECIEDNQNPLLLLPLCDLPQKDNKRTFCVESNHLITNYRFSLDFTSE